MLLDGGRKPEYLEDAHTDTVRTCTGTPYRRDTDRPVWGSNPRSMSPIKD